MTTISFKLSQDSIKEAIKELKAYKKSLEAKTQALAQALANLGIPVIESKMAGAVITYDADGVISGSENYHDTEVVIESDGYKTTANLIVSCEKIAFIEFGAGVYYNGAPFGSPHPKGAELGMLIGTYGHGNGQKAIWSYKDATGKIVSTRGTKATMPVYSASVEIINSYMKAAREVFSDG